MQKSFLQEWAEQLECSLVVSIEADGLRKGQPVRITVQLDI